MAKKLTNVTKKFESVTEFEKYCTNGKVNEEFDGQQYSIKGDKSFTGTESYEVANDLLLYGDRETAKKIEEAGVKQTRAKLMGQDFKRTNFANVVGFMPHVPNYIAGVPLSMIDTKRVQQPAKVIDIIYNCTVPWYIDTKEIIKVSANILSAILMIEASGVRVNLWLGASIHHKEQYVTAFVRIKKSDRKLDVLQTAYPLVNPSFFRRHFFRFVEVVPNYLAKGFNNSYGRTDAIISTMTEEAQKSGVKNAKVISFMEVRNLSAEDIIKRVQG